VVKSFNMQNFWATLPKPLFALAPLANVTDAAFRRVIAKYGKPDVLFTEFVSADGLVKGNREVLLRDLLFSEAEHPIVAQFFTSTPKHMEEAATLARDSGFDGIDINMGCPDRSIEKQSAGAALIKNPKLAQELIFAAKQGAGPLPVSVKTRLGYNHPALDEWLPLLLEAKPAAITIHARTRKEMSKVPARWEKIADAVKLARGSEVLIIGNGDVADLNDARKKVSETGCDGVMLGRAIFGNPWLFAEKIPTPEEKLQVLVEHTKLFEELLGDIKNFSIMKKHYKAYVGGFEGAKELRMELMDVERAEEVEKIVGAFLARDKEPVLI